MRQAEEKRVWDSLRNAWKNVSPEIASIENVDLDLSTPCLVFGGRNGAGKTRLLHSVAEHRGDSGLFLDLHFLCEQALTVLRSRDDFEDMAAEFGPLGPEDSRRDDVQRIVARDYDEVFWYALEVEPKDEKVAERFKWGGEQPLIPYFQVEHRGVSYTSKDMGLGEFSVHFLFWIIEQYIDADKLTLILDEPDAYLPPVGSSALLVRLLNICIQRGWRLIISTHSAEMISDAMDNEAFVSLHTGANSTITAIHSSTDPNVADALLSRPPLRYVFFVEDESAHVLSTVLLEKSDPSVSKCSVITWGNGSGYMSELQKHLPRPPDPKLKFAYIFDGDKREEINESSTRQWPILFLPTSRDPDDIFRSLHRSRKELARRLNISENALTRFFDQNEGADSHDWVNNLGVKFGRQVALRTLAELWTDQNSDEVALFASELKQIL